VFGDHRLRAIDQYQLRDHEPGVGPRSGSSSSSTTSRSSKRAVRRRPAAWAAGAGDEADAGGPVQLQRATTSSGCSIDGFKTPIRCISNPHNRDVVRPRVYEAHRPREGHGLVRVLARGEDGDRAPSACKNVSATASSSATPNVRAPAGSTCPELGPGKEPVRSRTSTTTRGSRTGATSTSTVPSSSSWRPGSRRSSTPASSSGSRTSATRSRAPALTLPDYNQVAMKMTGGSLFPFGWWHLAERQAHRSHRGAAHLRARRPAGVPAPAARARRCTSRRGRRASSSPSGAPKPRSSSRPTTACAARWRRWAGGSTRPTAPTG
jgi:hypothetical protein